jgi:hypothetical protein
MNFNAATAQLTGIPTTAGSFSFTISVHDSATTQLTGSQLYTVSIISSAILTISPNTMPGGTVNVPYVTQTLSASGGLAPYTFAITGGIQPPPGLALTGNTFGGTPTQAGTYTFTITATDSAGATGPQTYTIVINPASGGPGPPTIRFVHHRV